MAHNWSWTSPLLAKLVGRKWRQKPKQREDQV